MLEEEFVEEAEVVVWVVLDMVVIEVVVVVDLKVVVVVEAVADEVVLVVHPSWGWLPVIVPDPDIVPPQ